MRPALREHWLCSKITNSFLIKQTPSRVHKQIGSEVVYVTFQQGVLYVWNDVR